MTGSITIGLNVSRIFAALAIVSTCLLCVAFLLGLRIGKYNELYSSLIAIEGQLTDSTRAQDAHEANQLRSTAEDLYAQMQIPRGRATTHMLLGIVSGLVAVLVNSISVTYFIGTSRWCKEVVTTYALDASLSEESARLKRRTFPWSFTGILVVLLIVGLGGASDPGTLRTTTPQWVTPHLFASMCGTAWIAIAYMFQVVNIRSNSDLVDQIVARVQQIRRDRGLDIES